MNAHENTMPALTLNKIAKLMNRFDGDFDDMCAHLRDAHGVAMDERPTTLTSEGYILEGGRGAFYPTKDGWVGVASPANIDDAEAWRATYESQATGMTAHKWKAALRDTLFISERDFGEAMGHRDLPIDEPRPSLESCPSIPVVTIYDRDRPYGARYVPRPWLAHHGIERRIVRLTDIAALVKANNAAHIESPGVTTVQDSATARSVPFGSEVVATEAAPEVAPEDMTTADILALRD